MSTQHINVFSLGLQPYPDMLALQKKLFKEVVSGTRDNTLLLLRHNPVFTVGQGRDPYNNILVPKDYLQKEGIQIHHVERGGDITYHGPGQLMAYPLWRLNGNNRDLVKLVRNLEEIIILTLAGFGLDTVRRPGQPGIWLSGSAGGTFTKIASIGLAVRHWVTYHGVAVNFREEGQEPFHYINPCGLRDTRITSVEKETGLLPSWSEVEEDFICHFAKVTGYGIQRGTIEELPL